MAEEELERFEREHEILANQENKSMQVDICKEVLLADFPKHKDPGVSSNLAIDTFFASIYEPPSFIVNFWSNEEGERVL